MFTGGANGVFYLEVIERRPDGNLRVRNITERAKRKVTQTEAVIEPSFVFPLLRGRDVEMWSYKVSAYTICPHTAESKMRAVSMDFLRAKCPLTYAYLERFRNALEERKGFVGWERQYLGEAFYACQRIGTYTFAPYKVVWRYISREFTCCVVGPETDGQGRQLPVIPHEKLMLIPFQSEQEAYYVCGLLSSSPVKFFVESHMVETQIAPHVISRVSIPRFDEGNKAHVELSSACQHGHIARRMNNVSEYRRAEADIDRIIPEILAVTADDVCILKGMSVAGMTRGHTNRVAQPA